MEKIERQNKTKHKNEIFRATLYSSNDDFHFACVSPTYSDDC